MPAPEGMGRQPGYRRWGLARQRRGHRWKGETRVRQRIRLDQPRLKGATWTALSRHYRCEGSTLGMPLRPGLEAFSCKTPMA